MQKACWVLLLFLILVMGSCLDNDICLRGSDNALVIEFMKENEDGDEERDTVIIVNIAAEGADSVFYSSNPERNDTLRQAAVVALNPYANETLFSFRFPNDTLMLRVGYKSRVRFISEACGSERLQYDLEILETTFTDARVVRRSLDKGRSTNIEIYN